MRRRFRPPAFERFERRALCAATSASDFGWTDSFTASAGVINIDDIAVDSRGNRYVVGTMYDFGAGRATVDFDPGVRTVARSSIAGNVGRTAFVVKLDARGGLVWDRQFSATNIGSGGLSVAVDPAGSVIVGGGFSGFADFDPGAGFASRRSSFRPEDATVGNTTHQDLFLLKLNSLGGYVWDRRVPLARDAVTAVRCGLGVASDGAIFAAGEFRGTCDFDPGPRANNLTSTMGAVEGATTDVYVLKLSGAGGFNWVRRVGGEFDDTCSQLAIDSADNVVVSGTFAGTVDFNPSPMTLMLSSPVADGRPYPYQGDFVLKLSANASFRFAVTTGDIAYYPSVRIDTDASGNVFVATVRVSDAMAETRLRKLSVLGVVAWELAFRPADPSAEHYVVPRAVAADGAGNPVIGLSFHGPADLDPGAGAVRRTPAADGEDGLAVVKLAGGDGGYVWDRTFALTADPTAENDVGLAADAGGNVLLATNEMNAGGALLRQFAAPASIVGSTGDGWWVAANTGTELVNQRLADWMPAGGLTHVTSVDVDGDGDSDVVGRAVGGAWWVGRNDNGNRLVFVRFLATNAVMLDPQVGDVDGDGLADLLYRAPNTGMWVLWRGTGSAFTNVELLGIWNPRVTWITVGLADVDGDGDRDIVGRDRESGDWHVGRYSRAPRSTIVTTVFGRFGTASNWAHVTFCDWDGDGDADVVARKQSTGEWWLGRSDGQTFTNVSVGTTPLEVDWSDVQVADFDGDGDQDAIGRNANNGNWRLWRNDAGAEFTSILVGNWARGAWQFVTVGDFDGDGRADLAGRRPGDGAWHVALSKEPGLVSSVWGSWPTDSEWTNVRRMRR